MIRLTTALVYCEDRTILINPLHMVVVGPVPTVSMDDSPEGQQQYERIKKAFPGAKAQIELPTGRSVWVMESPAEVYEKIGAWFEETNKLHRSAEESVS